MVATSSIPTRQTAFDYDRTVVAFHGTRRSTAEKLVAGAQFGSSTNDDDWLGHGIYFWEFAPQQAWWWAKRRYGDQAAVVGALVRLGRCIDLLDPGNAQLLRLAHADLESTMNSAGKALPRNANNHKYLDCAVFNWLYVKVAGAGYVTESCRAVFVPLQIKKGLPRLGDRSGVFEELDVGTASGSQRTSWRSGRYERTGDMAGTSAKRSGSPVQPGPQAPPGVWTPNELAAAVQGGTVEEKIALLHTAGILDDNGDLARKYRSWGTKATRTPEDDDG